ncbi:unnamed protein product [Strongylus vulgaris]|uniref:Uncharacterized protein n=1 Tax=Strongylus vulgaris TaxID=40348 RepID=A0A3P7JKE5_STRVU|nr:unnamed protein product [Strongylus vulgaris]
MAMDFGPGTAVFIDGPAGSCEVMLDTHRTAVRQVRRNSNLIKQMPQFL